MSCKCQVEDGFVVRPCAYDAPYFYTQNVYEGAGGTFKSEGRKDSGTGRREIGYRVTLQDGRSFFTWDQSLAVQVADTGAWTEWDERVMHWS